MIKYYSRIITVLRGWRRKRTERDVCIANLERENTEAQAEIDRRRPPTTRAMPTPTNCVLLSKSRWGEYELTACEFARYRVGFVALFDVACLHEKQGKRWIGNLWPDRVPIPFWCPLLIQEQRRIGPDLVDQAEWETDQE